MRKQTHAEIYMKAITLLEEYKIAQHIPTAREEGPSVRDRWNPPLRGWYQVNTNEATFGK